MKIGLKSRTGCFEPTNEVNHRGRGPGVNVHTMPRERPRTDVDASNDRDDDDTCRLQYFAHHGG